MLTQTRIGRYEVVSALGQGAMGAVYKAVDPLIERTVAIKTIGLQLSKAERAEFEERFYREAKSAGRLNHANIVTIYDVGETEDIAYIAMEYVEGKSLRELLDSGVVLPTELIVRIAGRVANALHYAHENHVVHRDIKPANIMITSNRDVKIMDFGIAQIPTGSRTQLGTVLGSPKYMAPEQVTGQPTDGRTDIFALGVVLYEMLTGATPFNGDNLSAIMYQVLNLDPAPPSTVNPRVPPAFDRIVRRALAKRPEDRYRTAREFARDLKQLGGAPAEAAHRLPARARPANSPTDGAAMDEPTTVLLQPGRARARPVDTATDARREKPARGRRRLVWVALPLAVVAGLAVVAWGPGREHAPAPAPAPLTAAPAPAERVAAAPVKSAAETAVMPDVVPAVAPESVPPAARQPARSAGTVAQSAPAPRPAAPAKATLVVAVAPWGEVYVDGRSAGVSPPLTVLEIAAGRHDVEIRNPAFAAHRETVNLKAGQTLKLRHKFK